VKLILVDAMPEIGWQASVGSYARNYYIQNWSAIYRKRESLTLKL
jgi:hypothetical protein